MKKVNTLSANDHIPLIESVRYVCDMVGKTFMEYSSCPV